MTTSLATLLVVFLTLLDTSAGASSSGDTENCDFSAVIKVANTNYAECRDLYNVLEQSAPVSDMAKLCNNTYCMEMIEELRDMDLGDCIIFDSTTLNSDILDQCPSDNDEANFSWTVALCALMLIFVVAGLMVHRIKVWRKMRAADRLEATNGKLGSSDGDYKMIELGDQRV